MSLIVTHLDRAQEGPLGGKARALASLSRAGFPVPEWLVVLPPEGAAGWAEMSAEFRVRIDAVVREIFPDGGSLAVRSSAAEEDGVQLSFAGQLDSFLFVSPADVCANVVKVWRSAAGERVRAYRREHGLPADSPPPAVLVQRMVEPTASGVAFGADPVGGRRAVAVVSALWGVGTALVSGECEADTFEVDREGLILSRRVADKRKAHRRSSKTAEGVEPADVPAAQALEPSLTDEQVRRAAELARLAGRHFGRPQDIEWAVSGGALFLLQSRPITSLAGLADSDGDLNLWDNSNIAESYSGITTPLTFSFARYVYEEVYQQFCRIMGVPEKTIAANKGTFRRMIGLIRGRVYYNLGSWYRLLSMLPGFTMNRPFMEQMMGVKAGIPPRILAEFHTPADPFSRLLDGARFVGTLFGTAYNYWSLPRKIEFFYRRLDLALSLPRPELADMTVDELSRLYRDMERRLLTRWDAPLINDFFAMIFYGLLRSLAKTWCGDEDGTLQNDLFCGEGGMISAEPAARVREMTEAARPHPGLVAALCEGAPEEIRAALAAAPELERLSRAYLAEFGERCLEELKLETRTLNDDPLVLWRSIGRLARGGVLPGEGAGLGTKIRGEAEKRTGEALAGRPLCRLVFGLVLRQARRRVRDRENLRFERTRVFGRVRLIFLELGRRLHALDRLESPRDVYFLTVEEVFGFIEGTAVTLDLKALVRLRRDEFRGYAALTPPADRFETYGTVNQGNDFAAAGAPAPEPGGEFLKGLGCCPGVVRGRARVILDPRDSRIERGEILVALRTDPGWVMLFPAAAGLLVEYGSLLSHSAIVARELGLPAIVSAPGATRWVRTGEWLEINGKTGVARKIVEPG